MDVSGRTEIIQARESVYMQLYGLAWNTTLQQRVGVEPVSFHAQYAGIVQYRCIMSGV